MALFRSSFALPLGTDPSARFLGWITAAMCYLAALALAAAMLVADMSRRLDAGLAGGLTVQVAAVPPAGAPPRPLAERVEAAVTVLRATAGVRSVTPLGAAESARLLEPWLGREVANDPLLPVPALIDVVTDGPVAVADLARRLAEAAPGAHLDDHAAWLADLARFTAAAQAVALGVLLLVGGTAVAAVVFAVRAGLSIHHGVVELLHHMGATDFFVARQFERHVLWRTLEGGFGGLFLAALTLLGLGEASRGLQASLLPAVTLAPWEWSVLLAVPLAAALLAVATARWTVLRALATLP